MYSEIIGIDSHYIHVNSDPLIKLYSVLLAYYIIMLVQSLETKSYGNFLSIILLHRTSRAKLRALVTGLSRDGVIALPFDTINVRATPAISTFHTT